MTPRRVVLAVALVALLLAPMVASKAATAEFCSARAQQVVGWGGSRFVPVPPQGIIGASCTFHAAEATILNGRARGFFLTGGMQMILPDGRRYFCRDPLTEVPFGLLGTTLGQQHPSIYCTIDLFGRLDMIVFLPAAITGDVYCSTTGEVGIQTEIICRAGG